MICNLCSTRNDDQIEDALECIEKLFEKAVKQESTQPKELKALLKTQKNLLGYLKDKEINVPAELLQQDSVKNIKKRFLEEKIDLNTALQQLKDSSRDHRESSLDVTRKIQELQDVII